MSPVPKVDFVCVSYGSGKYFEELLRAIADQEGVDLRVVLIEQRHGAAAPVLDGLLVDVEYYRRENQGYAGGNNFGFCECRKDSDYIVFINPDCFLIGSDFCARAVATMQATGAGIIGPSLLRYDMLQKQPVGRYDSVGIVRRWYGRWVDWRQNEAVGSDRVGVPTKVDALCGACLFCDARALREAQKTDGFIFNPSFFMYKEDIELCVRMASFGWPVVLAPELHAYHCRGWHQDTTRAEVPWRLRLRSAFNECRINYRWLFPFLYSTAKVMYVIIYEGACELVLGVHKKLQ